MLGYYLDYGETLPAVPFANSSSYCKIRQRYKGLMGIVTAYSYGQISIFRWKVLPSLLGLMESAAFAFRVEVR
jgi:hypothetical protein